MFGPSLLKISYSLLLPGDIIDLSALVPASTPSLFEVAAPPPSLQPFIITISGASDIQFLQGEKRVCWGVRTIGSGGRGVRFTVTASTSALESVLEWKDVGWEGAGWGELCVEEWGEAALEGEYEYTFAVEGQSVLFGSVATTTHSFRLSSFGGSESTTDSSCSPSLWDTTPNTLYGIQMYPSGLQLLPPSLRLSPFTVNAKALSPCSSIGMSKDILLPFDFNWTLLEPIPEGLLGVDLNDWSMGAQLVIPSSILEDRDAFPMNEPVGIKVRAPL